MYNPAATATNRPTQKHKVPKYFKGEKVAKHPDLVTVSINFVFILFDNFAATARTNRRHDTNEVQLNSIRQRSVKLVSKKKILVREKRGF